jgi:hypothetical protein
MPYAPTMLILTQNYNIAKQKKYSIDIKFCQVYFDFLSNLAREGIPKSGNSSAARGAPTRP